MIGKDDVDTAPGKVDRGLAAEFATSTGDDGDFVLQSSSVFDPACTAQPLAASASMVGRREGAVRKVVS